MARPARMPHADRRAQVLELAEDLFAREGFHHVSMDDIADRAGVSKPVLYRHFPSKLDLYLAVVDRRGEVLVRGVEAELERALADETLDGFEIVQAIVGAFVHFTEEAGATSSLLFESDVTHDADVKARVESASRRTAEAICRTLVTFTGLPDARAQLLAEVLVAMAQETATSRLRGHDVPTDEAITLVSRLAWAGLEGLRAASADG